jgi:hypothetical protein
LEAAFVPKTSDLTVWDGEGFADGNGWIAPKGNTAFRVTSAEHYNGAHALQYHVEGVESSSGGWNWANWHTNEAKESAFDLYLDVVRFLKTAGK